MSHQLNKVGTQATELRRHALGWGTQMEVRAEGWYLSRHPGAVVVARNLRFSAGEIDRIFLLNRALIFLEIKARGQNSGVEVHEAFGPGKRHRLRAASDIFQWRKWRLLQEIDELRWELLTYQGPRIRPGELLVDEGGWVHYSDLDLGGRLGF
jgi:Holliday junction resolvase-like predicted endonuclease